MEFDPTLFEQIRAGASKGLVEGTNGVTREIKWCDRIAPEELHALRCEFEKSFQSNLLDLDELLPNLPDHHRKAFLCLLSRDLNAVLDRYLFHLRIAIDRGNELSSCLGATTK